MSPTPDRIDAAALLRRQQSTTARLRARLTDLLDELDELEEPVLDLRDGDPTPEAEVADAGAPVDDEANEPS